MQRYTVTIVSGGTPGQQPTLVVPFEPSAIVTAFIEELFKRIARQGLALAPNTHIATLHLDSQTGAIIDCEDVLADVVDPKSEKLFAVFSAKAPIITTTTAGQQAAAHRADEASASKQSLSVRVVTPALAKSGTASMIQLPLSTTILQLHTAVAAHLRLPDKTATLDTLECCCSLARKLADGPSPPTQFLVVRGKSTVQRFDLQTASDDALKDVIREHFGQDVESKKKLSFYGAESSSGTWTKSPIVAICSKHRHIPVHAKAVEEDSSASQSRVLDLHSFETPILTSASSEATLESTGLAMLANEGVLDIYAVHRLATDGATSPTIGKGSIYRARAHWVPVVPQSDRGIALFLSSLRVFANLVQSMDEDGAAQDAILHVLDLMSGSGFPPALRTLHILVQGRTPTAVESAALGHLMFEILDSFMPTAIIGTTHSRVLEGSRLLFGFILDKARSLKLTEVSRHRLPYLSSFQDVDLKDHITLEAVLQAVQTTDGLIEKALCDAFGEDGLLTQSHLQPHIVQTEADTTVARVALLTAGTSSQVSVFNLRALKDNYRYEDAGNVDNALDLAELSELHHLAEICKLRVQRPSQLSSAVAPCLTFDRNAHLAVYLGEEGCGTPGRSSMLFRPKHGDETIDAGVVEQLISPIIRTYEADGSAVFDALGGAEIRRLQTPDEILIFVVDTSASMRSDTDFEDDEEDDDTAFTEEPTADSLVQTDLYNKTTFDDVKQLLCGYEAFNEMVSIVADAHSRDRNTARRVLDILRSMLSTEIVTKHKDLEKRRERGIGASWQMRQVTAGLETALDKFKKFWAGLKTHEEAALDFLTFRGTAVSSTSISQQWTWSVGDAVPTDSQASHHIPTLPPFITEVDNQLCCPISHALMEDAVTAADQRTYSKEAIDRWFSIRHSSPMHGLRMEDLSLREDLARCRDVSNWISGGELAVAADDEPSPKKMCPTNTMDITFVSSVGSFERRMAGSASLDDLYKVAFRGLKARHMVFQLALGDNVTLRPSRQTLASTKGIQSGARIDIRIADDTPVSSATSRPSAGSNDMCLIKIYGTAEEMLFGFWVKRNTPLTLASVLWKYYRYRFTQGMPPLFIDQQLWTDMHDDGDSFLAGTPLPSTHNLSLYLNARHCYGRLGAENIYSDPSRAGTRPFVLKLQVLAAYRPKAENNTLSRLDVLKQMFESLINRMIAYGYKAHVGLVQFGTKAKVAMPISHVIENFRRAVANMRAEGDTALWDAIALAQDQLKQYAIKYPTAKKRIICISDGKDTKSSSNTARDLAWTLSGDGILLDSVCLGWEDNVELRTISGLLGCYRFKPTSMVTALAICELETFLSINERPEPTQPPGTPKNRSGFLSHFRYAQHCARPTVVTSDEVPPRKEHPNLHDEFVELTAMAARPDTTARNIGGTSRSNFRISRLMNEMRAIAGGEHFTWDVYVSETDMSFWKIVFSGPEGPYEDGAFMMYLHADESCPTFAPKARFVTKIMHPNVNSHGRVCHSIFDRNWTTDTSMTMVLDTVYGLLLQPETSDPVNTTRTLEYHHDPVECTDEVREYVGRHAYKTREEWKAVLLGLEDESSDDEEFDDLESDDEEINVEDFENGDDEMEVDENGGVSSVLGDD